jgi:CubicO group peptidase (beta-lactamase class C family)
LPTFSLLIALFGACSGTNPESRAVAAGAPSVAPAARRVPPELNIVSVDADTPMTTTSGSTYVAPKGWTVTTRQGATVLQDSNREISVTFVERKEQDGSAAIAAAWKQIEPELTPSAQGINAWPGRGGWDARMDADYETKMTDGRSRWAHAWRKGDTWFVALSTGTREGWQRRGSQARMARESFRAKGVVEETFEGKTAHALDATRLVSLEAFVEEGRRAAKIPGIAVAIVQGGKVVFAKGFGVRALGRRAPVTPNTLFRIASLTKPLTSLMVAALVTEGKLDWDTHVTELYRDFAVGDADLTKKMTVRDALCACTGVPYDNLGTDFEYLGVSAEKWLERTKELVPTTAFGETVQESNPMIAAAGYVAAHAFAPTKPLGEAYDRAMRDKVFGPLGMTATTFDPKVVARSEHASPHLRENVNFDWALAPSDVNAWLAPMNPSMGAWSTVSDLAKVLAMELANGRTPDGKQAFAEKELRARREPRARRSEKSRYGLGLYVDDYRGVRIYGTAGHAPGYSSDLFFLPDHDVAGVMLTNADPPSPLTSRFQRRVLELLFDGRDEAREDLLLDLKKQEAAHAKEVSQVDFTPDRAFFERFTGTYENALYGKITIRLEGKGAVLDAGEWKTTVGRKREADGTEKLVGTPPPWLGWPSFVRRESGGKVTLEMQSGQRRVIFERREK